MDTPLQTAPPIFDQRLATRLLRIVFGCYFLVTLVVTTVQLTAEYQHAANRLEREIEAMEATFGPGITDALWRFNNDVLRGILSGMNALPTVVGTRVDDAQGKLVAASGAIQDAQGRKMTVSSADGALSLASEGLFERMFSRSFEVVHVDQSGERRVIGRWTIYSSRAIILKQVEYGFMLILVNSVIKTLALWFIFVFVINRALGKPLKQLSEFVGQLSIDNLGDKSFVLKDRGRHELHMLAHKLNQMIQSLRSSVEDNGKLYRNLEVMNRTLEAQVAERTEDLLKLSVTDPLTELYNRRKIDEVLAYEVERTQRYKESLVVIIGDIDHFKAINDRYGHPTGDRVLLAVAEVLRVSRRVADTVGRWGGEEFMIVCPHTELAGAQVLADSMRQQVEQIAAGLDEPVHISFGVAMLEPGETAAGVTARADAAMYRAKANGRNRIEAA
jgi:diguanylate cyclase (GGDEF)-like protein